MVRIVTGATGLIGRHLIGHWLKQKHSLIAVGRSAAHIQKVFGEQVRAVTWDELSPEIMQTAEVVVNLAGASVGTKPWSYERKQEILDSRLNTTKRLNRLLIACEKNAPTLLNASAIGIYGIQTQRDHRLPPSLDESVTIDCQNPVEFLSLVGCRWEQALQPAILQGAHVIFLRFGVVLAKQGGALPDIMRPFKFYVGGPIGTGHQPFSWVAIDDVIRAMDFLLANKEAYGAYNIVSPQCVSQQTFAETLAKVMGRPCWLRMPAYALKYLFGIEKARELLLEGQHVYPQRLLDMGFEFSYPDLESALNHILHSSKKH